MQDFRSLKVWEKAHSITMAIHQLSLRFPSDEKFGLTIQMRRSATAVPTHIAEGCGSLDGQDYSRHFQNALRSACELEYLLLLSRDLAYTPTEIYAELEPRIVEVKKMLTAYIQKIRAGNP